MGKRSRIDNFLRTKVRSIRGLYIWCLEARVIAEFNIDIHGCPNTVCQAL